MLDKITFVNGTIVTKDYLNEVQKGTDFSGSPARDDFYSVTDTDHNSWSISQRDKLKDYEIADPREEQETAIGRLAHDGVILGYSGIITNVSEAVFSEPKTVPINIGDDQTITIDTTGAPESNGVIIEAGKIVLSDGSLFSWPRQIIGLISSTGKNYVYVAEKGSSFTTPRIAISSTLPAPASNPYVPLAELNFTNGQFNTDSEGSVMGTGVIDLRPNLFVGALNNYSTGVLKNTDIINVSTQLNSWERGVVDTRNGSVIITLPTNPSDNDRVAIVDIEGAFDRYPVVLRPATNTKINSSVDDWIINIRDSHIELFYHEATAEWRFEETPGSECAPKLGTFISCGGKEFIGERTAAECPDGQAVPASYPNPSEGVYRYEAATQKCYKEITSTTAIYSDGQGGLIKVFKAGRCIKAGSAGAAAESTLRSIIYVDPAVGNDEIDNNGTDPNKPFRTVERALLEAARASRRRVGLDAYDTTVIELAPGDYYIDNSPGVNAVAGQTAGDAFIKQVDTGFSCLNQWTEDTPYVAIETNDSVSTQPPLSLNLGRVLYTKAGGVGTIYKIEKDSLTSSRWKVYLQYVSGSFSPGEQLYYNRLSDFNPSDGGVIVPRGISVNGVDLRKVRIRPMYVPALTPGQNVAQDKRTYIFKVTGGTYISLLTFTDNQQFSRTHNTVTAVGFASESEIKGSDTETSYYQKVASLFSGIDGWGTDGLAPVTGETTIVAPLAASKNDRSQDLEQNQTGIQTPDLDTTAPPEYPGPSILKVNEAGSTTFFKLPDVNSTRSSSPYVFNCSVRSIFGLNGMWVDGSRVSGFKSMVTANYTQVSLQTDPNCFETPSVDYYSDPPVNKQTGDGKKYRACSTDPFKYRHWGFRGSYDATIQLVSCFVIGNADHFISESGADLSITNSCSDFGDISLRALGYKERAFSQDEGIPQGTYLGTKITEIIPPLPLSYNTLPNGAPPTLADTSINTGLTIDFQEVTEYVKNNAVGTTPPSTLRIYVLNSDTANPFALNNPPSASDMAFGQYSYTKKAGDGTYILAGGQTRKNRGRLYVTGFDYEGNSILYTGNIQIQQEGASGFENLDDRSKIFVWDSIVNKWYVEVTTTDIAEETPDENAEDGGDKDGDGYILKKFDYAFIWLLSTDTDQLTEALKEVSFIFDRSPIKIIRGVDQRTDRDRVYKAVFEGHIKDAGIRRPQSYYILEKQQGVAGFPLNGGNDLTDNPIVVTQVQTYDSYYRPGAVDEKYPGKYIVYITQSAVARDVFAGELHPAQDRDEPEATEDPAESITKVALLRMKDRPGVSFSSEIAPGIEPIYIKTSSTSSQVGFLTSLRRPSVIRASGHTWEWTGYLNYDTSFPTYQGEPLEQDFALGKIIVEETGGRVYATGMNEEGNYYLGTTVFDLRSGEQFSIPLKAENEAGNVSNQVLNNVIIKSNLLLADDSSTIFGNDTKIFFAKGTQFFSTTTGAITAQGDPKNNIKTYASTAYAGLVQLASGDQIRGAKLSGNKGVAQSVVVTAADLASELDIRFENNLKAGEGIKILYTDVEAPGGDPNDPGDDIKQANVGVDPDYPGFTPVGGIIMWSGADADIPTGWALCNGQTSEGKTTPDLTDRFVIGKGTNATGTAGGPSISGSTDSHGLTRIQVPNHTHGVQVSPRGTGGGQTYTTTISYSPGSSSATVLIEAAGFSGGGGGCNSDDYCDPSGGNTLNPGGVGAGHSHGLSGVTDVKPKWYALAFIMRVK